MTCLGSFASFLVVNLEGLYIWGNIKLDAHVDEDLERKTLETTHFDSARKI
jgi:hypothetical protein